MFIRNSVQNRIVRYISLVINTHYYPGLVMNSLSKKTQNNKPYKAQDYMIDLNFMTFKMTRYRVEL